MKESHVPEKNAKRIPIVIFVGPTAVGKSKIAMNIAQLFNGAIINADSRQIYKYMDVGTAKPSKEDRSMIDHYLFDLVDPNDEYNISKYLTDARESIISINKTGKLPLIVGGTGQYIFGLVDGYITPEVPPNYLFRERMDNKAQTEGSIKLWQDLNTLDPVSANSIDHRNIRRVIRALEVFHETGKLFSELKTRVSTLYDELIIGLYMDRQFLYTQIDNRVDEMISLGWPAEVKKLLDMGFTENLSSMSSLGYREIASYVKGESDLENVVSKIKTLTHRFARQQYSWLRPKNRNVEWIDVNDEYFMSHIKSKIVQYLSKFDTNVIKFT